MLLLCAFLAAAFHPVVRAEYATINGHPCFRSLDGMTQSMFDLADAHPDLVTVKDIGDSYLKSTNSKNNDFNIEEGYDIYVMVITSPNGPHQSSEKGKMLVTSGVHAREYAPPELNMRFAETLVDGYDENADITWLLQHTEIHSIVYVNPDGRNVAENYPDEYWRKNIDPKAGCSSGYGVDINRNFDFMWGDLDGASDNPCDEDYHGKSADSEPETQAVVNYARGLFPEGQRKENPKEDRDVPVGEDISGMFVDVHSSGGYVYYPWGHENKRSPDDDALRALGQKLAYFNNYKMWAPGYPDFVYPASGDASDYMYGVLGVASFGLELGEDFYEDCDIFEDEVVPINMPALLYAAMITKKPFSRVKGPDILDLDIVTDDTSPEDIKVIAVASDSKMLDGHFTGNQDVTKVQLYLDVHPDDYVEGDMTWEMQSVDDNSDARVYELGVTFPAGVSSGRHTLFAQAMDSDNYVGPVSSRFIDVERKETAQPSDGPTSSPSSAPTDQPTSNPTRAPSIAPTTVEPTAIPSFVPSKSPTTTEPSMNPTTAPIISPTYTPSKNPTNAPTDQPTTSPFGAPSIAPTTSNPTAQATFSPSASPTNVPTTPVPSFQPTDNPTKLPTEATLEPTSSPTPATQEQSSSPTPAPTSNSQSPTSELMTANPTTTPTAAPTTPVTQLDKSFAEAIDKSSSGITYPSIAVAVVSALLVLYLG